MRWIGLWFRTVRSKKLRCIWNSFLGSWSYLVSWFRYRFLKILECIRDFSNAETCTCLYWSGGARREPPKFKDTSHLCYLSQHQPVQYYPNTNITILGEVLTRIWDSQPLFCKWFYRMWNCIHFAYFHGTRWSDHLLRIWTKPQPFSYQTWICLTMLANSYI